MAPEKDVREEFKTHMECQLRRQALWLKESYLWLLRTKVFSGSGESTTKKPKAAKAAKPTALDVGCGPGFVMDILCELFDVRGIDCDHDMVAMCRSRGLEVKQALAESLPFEDESFDVVYCSHLLMGVKDPARIVREMTRVSRTWVLCLAESDIGARVDYPFELEKLNEVLIKGVLAYGGDPFMGRKLRAVFHECGLGSEMGIHPGVWDIERLWEESEDEWRWAMMTIGDEARQEELDELKSVWEKALENGVLFQFNPIFYCLGKK